MEFKTYLCIAVWSIILILIYNIRSKRRTLIYLCDYNSEILTHITATNRGANKWIERQPTRNDTYFYKLVNTRRNSYNTVKDSVTYYDTYLNEIRKENLQANSYLHSKYLSQLKSFKRTVVLQMKQVTSGLGEVTLRVSCLDYDIKTNYKILDEIKKDMIVNYDMSVNIVTYRYENN